MHQGRELAATFWITLRSQLYTNTAYLCFAILAFALLEFAFWAAVARLYQPEAVGSGGSAVTALVVLSQVSQLGLGYALIRFIPHSGPEAPLLLSRSLVAVTAAPLLTSVLFLGTLPFWSPDLQDVLWKNAGYVGGFVAFVTFVTVAEQLRFTFIAYRRGIFVLALNLLIGLLRLPVVTLLAGLGSAFGIVTAHGLAVLLTILLAALFFLLSHPQAGGIVLEHVLCTENIEFSKRLSGRWLLYLPYHCPDNHQRRQGQDKAQCQVQRTSLLMDPCGKGVPAHLKALFMGNQTTLQPGQWHACQNTKAQGDNNGSGAYAPGGEVQRQAQ
jgi:hypothetical protein